MDKLLPCPFCGRAPQYDKITIITTHELRKELDIVMCQCGGIALGLSKDDAKRTWNRRPSHE